MSLRRVSAIAILILSLGTAVALADSQARSPHQIAQNQDNLQRPRGGNPAGLMQALNLSQEQKQKLETIRKQSQAQMGQRKQALRQAEQSLRQMMQGTDSADQLRAQHQQVQELRQQMENLRFENMLAMREVLTPEQRAKFAELMQQRHRKFPKSGKRNDQGVAVPNSPG